jgi:hypothetical protein
MAKNMNVSLAYGSHLPCLIKAVEKNTGVFSTPYLRYKAMLDNRKLLSLENFKGWYDFLRKYYDDNKNHEIHFVEKYADAPVKERFEPWSVVLIDQTPDSSRVEEALKLKDKAEYIIVHDSNPSNYKVTHYDELYPHFKYKTDWMGDNNRATILSNLVDLKDFWK